MHIRNDQLITLIVSGLLILGAITNFWYNEAVNFEENAAKEISESIVILHEIEALTIPLAENIPFLKNWAGAYQTDFDKLLTYLNFSSLLMLLQFTLLKLSHWWLFKLFLVLMFIGLFFPFSKALCFNLLVLGLMISPGLSIYTQLMASTTYHMKLDMGADLKTHLSATKDSINNRKIFHQAKLDSLKAHQRAVHGGKLNIFDKAKDEAIKLTYNVEDELARIGGEILDVLRFASNHSLELAVGMLVNVFVVFALLPLLFWYVFSIWLKKLFGYNKSFDAFNGENEALKNKIEDGPNKN
jgi:hypothetical protein